MNDHSPLKIKGCHVSSLMLTKCWAGNGFKISVNDNIKSLVSLYG